MSVHLRKISKGTEVQTQKCSTDADVRRRHAESTQFAEGLRHISAPRSRSYENRRIYFRTNAPQVKSTSGQLTANASLEDTPAY